MVLQIFSTDWLDQPLNLRYVKVGEESTFTGYAVPDLAAVRSVAPLLRQLYSTSPSDDLVRRAHRIYLQFCSSEGKHRWLANEFCAFESFMAAPPLLLRGCGKTNRQVLDMALYGTNLMHATPYRGAHIELREFFREFGSERGKFTLHNCLKSLAVHAKGWHHVIRQDLNEWLRDPTVTKPTVLSLAATMG